MMLIVDSREAERQKGILATLESFLDQGEVEVALLDSGDFACVDAPLSLGIERKSFANLVSSMMNGELDEQCSRLIETYDVPVLLVEGLPSPYGDGKVRVWGAKKTVPFAWVTSVIMDWSARGITYFGVESLSATPAAVVALYRWARKPGHREKYRMKRVLPPLEKIGLREEVLCTFPGMGLTRAKKVVEAWPEKTLADLAVVEEKEWEKLLGKVTGERMYREWRSG